MPYARASDGTRLYYETEGAGTPVVFVHEYAGDHRSWEPQMRFLSRQHMCIAFNARGYPPSDVPAEDRSYAQAIARDDVIAVMDHLGLADAHVVGHSMGAYSALHVGLDHPARCRSLTIAGCGWGSSQAGRAEAEAAAREFAALFRNAGIEAAALAYASQEMRLPFKAKDPRGWAEFAQRLAEHSAEGHALTMLNVQMRRPSLYEMRPRLEGLRLPTLVIVGDEDSSCLDGSLMLKRAIPTAALMVVPRAGHTINSEEPDLFNRALFDFFAAVEAGRWLAHRPG
jgi:pimeloyl-ACP methyl ester carboxylesterase